VACTGHSTDSEVSRTDTYITIYLYLNGPPPARLLGPLSIILSTSQSGYSSQWVSLKIKQSRLSQGPLEQDPEVQALLALEKAYASSNQKLSRCFTRLLAAFQITGPNGVHNCLVTELVGPSVARVLRACSLFGETLRPDTILRASRRVLEAVAFAHHIGVVHGGT
jgi:hypothetical protein